MAGPKPEEERPDWGKWKLIPKCRLWQAVCLSNDVEPSDQLARELRDRGRFRDRELEKRLQVLQDNLSTDGPIHPQGPFYRGMLSDRRCPVLLAEVASFASDSGWPIPEPMRELVQQPIARRATAEPAQAAGPAAGDAGGVKTAPEPGPSLGAAEADWKELARARAKAIIKRQRAEHDLYPSQVEVADEIARAFRAEGVVGAGGKPLSSATIKRHALFGISSARGGQLSTGAGRGK